MTNLTRLRLILVDLSGLMKKKTYVKQNVLFVKRRLIFRWLHRYKQNFMMMMMMINFINVSRPHSLGKSHTNLGTQLIDIKNM